MKYCYVGQTCCVFSLHQLLLCLSCDLHISLAHPCTYWKYVSTLSRGVLSSFAFDFGFKSKKTLSSILFHAAGRSDGGIGSSNISSTERSTLRLTSSMASCPSAASVIAFVNACDTVFYNQSLVFQQWPSTAPSVFILLILYKGLASACFSRVCLHETVYL